LEVGHNLVLANDVLVPLLVLSVEDHVDRALVAVVNITVIRCFNLSLIMAMSVQRDSGALMVQVAHTDGGSASS
jgi:hypothetical protein